MHECSITKDGFIKYDMSGNNDFIGRRVKVMIALIISGIS